MDETPRGDAEGPRGRFRGLGRWLFAQAPVRGAQEVAPPDGSSPGREREQADEPTWSAAELRDLAGDGSPPPAPRPGPAPEPGPEAPRRRPRPGPAPSGRPRPGAAAARPRPPASTPPAPAEVSPATWAPPPWAPEPTEEHRPLRAPTEFTPQAERVADTRPPAAPSGTVRRRLIFSAAVVVLVVAAAVVVRAFVAAPFYIPSASMEPTLHGCPGCNDDHVLVDKLAYRVHGVHRGDVIVFNRPSSWHVDEQHLIKRVIGLPGDVLTVRKGILYVNGLEIVEPYLEPDCGPLSSLGESPSAPTTHYGPIPPNEVFVMGDNRCDSADSRAFGPVPESDIVGRAFLIVWPLNRLHYL